MRFSPLMLSRSTRGAKKRRPAFGSDAALAESISLVTLCAVIFIGRVSGSLRLAQMEIFDADDKNGEEETLLPHSIFPALFRCKHHLPLFLLPVCGSVRAPNPSVCSSFAVECSFHQYQFQGSEMESAKISSAFS